MIPSTLQLEKLNDDQDLQCFYHCKKEFLDGGSLYLKTGSAATAKVLSIKDSVKEAYLL
jgi:hypothetical protein